ncbi:hypothetical protein IJ135_01100 [Candidatus Saccharibacteria bacterium]|nr:hypothetical protein [Candidatus Saccharibacteria bacterium]
MNKLIEKLKKDYPEVRFKTGVKFLFRPPRTVVVGPEMKNSELILLHEMGHFISKHYNYQTYAERLKIEREAWEIASGLAARYGVKYDEDVVEDELDTYRDWLDQKSRCPECGLTRFQTPDGVFHCPRCDVE